jgi:hypothetical protein
MNVNAIELSVLAAPGDLPFLPSTIRHQLRTFSACELIDRRALVLDLREDTPTGDKRTLLGLGEKLVEEGLLDDVRTVDWSDERVAASLLRWYGSAGAPRGAGRHGRAARYQFIYSIDSAARQRVLHLDSDVLVHMSKFTWLEESAEVFSANPKVVAIVPYGEVPQANRAIEWILGERVDRPNYPSGWLFNTDFTSRAFLIDRGRIERALFPLPLPDPAAHLEANIADALRSRQCQKATLVDPTEYFLHPHRHNEHHIRYLEELIELVEQGRYPYRRVGHPWDITTEGRRFIPWWVLAKLSRSPFRGRHRRQRAA